MSQKCLEKNTRRMALWGGVTYAENIRKKSGENGLVQRSTEPIDEQSMDSLDRRYVSNFFVCLL